MVIAITICAVVGLYLLIATTLLRLSTRIVAGVVPTFGSAAGAILAGIVVGVILAIVATAIGFGHGGYRISTYIFSLSIQARVYSAVLKDRDGGGITYLQALIAILCQIPIAIGVVLLLGVILAAGGLTVASMVPHVAQPFGPSSPAPRSAPATPALPPPSSGPRWGTLETSVIVPARYGRVTYRAGTAVQIVRETAPDTWSESMGRNSRPPGPRSRFVHRRRTLTAGCSLGTADLCVSPSACSRHCASC